jgi:hypothetical protein
MNVVWGALCAILIATFGLLSVYLALPEPTANPATACPCRMVGATMICPEGAFEHLEWRPRTESDGPPPATPARRSRI